MLGPGDEPLEPHRGGRSPAGEGTAGPRAPASVSRLGRCRARSACASAPAACGPVGAGAATASTRRLPREERASSNGGGPPLPAPARAPAVSFSPAVFRTGLPSSEILDPEPLDHQSGSDRRRPRWWRGSWYRPSATSARTFAVTSAPPGRRPPARRRRLRISIRGRARLGPAPARPGHRCQVGAPPRRLAGTPRRRSPAGSRRSGTVVRPPCLVPRRRGLDLAGVRMPQLRRLAGTRKTAVRLDAAVALVGDEVDVGVTDGAVDEHEPRVARRARRRRNRVGRASCARTSPSGLAPDHAPLPKRVLGDALCRRSCPRPRRRSGAPRRRSAG